jgi:hypothetical protein
MSSRPAIARIASTTSGATVKPSWLAKRRGPQHPQRVVAEGVLRPARGAQPLRSEVVQPAVRVDEGVRGPPVRQRDGHRVDREVPAGQVLAQRVAVLHDRVARRAVVRLRAVGRDLDPEAARWTPTVPNAIPVSQVDSAQPSTSCLDPLGPSVGGEVQVVPEPAEQRVAHRAADQVQRVPGGAEPLAQLAGDRRHAQQLADGVLLELGQVGHGRRGYGCAAAGRLAGSAPAGDDAGGRTDGGGGMKGALDVHRELLARDVPHEMVRLSGPRQQRRRPARGCWACRAAASPCAATR